MKRIVTQLAIVALAVGCSGIGSMKDQDAVRRAVLQDSARQRVAWAKKDARLALGETADSASLASVQQQMDSTEAVKQLTIHIDSIDVSGATAAVVSTQTLARVDASGQTHTATVKQKQQYKKYGTEWKPEGGAEQLTADAGNAKPKA